VKVLHLASSFPRWDGDASGVFILDLCRVLDADVHVVAPHDAGAATEEDVDGVHVHRFRYAPDAAEVLAHRGGLLKAVRNPTRWPLVPLFLLSFWRAARRVDADVVHAHWWFPAGVVAAALRRPYVVTIHGSDLHLARLPLLRQLAGAVLRRAAVVGVVSEALRRDVRELFGIEARLLRMPVQVDGPPSPLPVGPIRVVAAGRNAPEKGFDVLEEATRDLDVIVDLYGEATPHGAVTRAELADAMRAAHAVVVPSRREGLGIVAVEAMALGRPVIASAVGGLPETVEDGIDGILVPPDDPVALRAAIERLPLPPPRGAAVERHSAAAVAAAHAEAYVIARRR
jgi:glycosyltransferase involved in cell wall biosynthesis